MVDEVGTGSGKPAVYEAGRCVRGCEAPQPGGFVRVTVWMYRSEQERAAELADTAYKRPEVAKQERRDDDHQSGRVCPQADSNTGSSAIAPM